MSTATARTRGSGVIGRRVRACRAAWPGLALCVVAVSGAGADPGVPPSHSWTFATIGNPGNRAANAAEAGPIPPLRPLGSVGYTYRIATTEVTNGQWSEFVNAYAPYENVNNWFNSTFTGAAMFTGFVNGRPNFTVSEELRDVAVQIGWRYAARFVNWLHNGRPTGGAITQPAFENGAYDTSTFGVDPVTGYYTDQASRSPGARYWIPSENEWIKAAFYDPNRYGVGQEGYWRYGIGQDTPPVYGLPGTPGAQSAAGLAPGPPYQPEVGSFPGVLSPWGLLDVSGGATEWTEDWQIDPVFRRARGAADYSGLLGDYFDQLPYSRAGSPTGTFGLRLASAVPAPGTWIAMVALGVMSARRTRSVRCVKSERSASSR